MTTQDHLTHKPSRSHQPEQRTRLEEAITELLTAVHAYDSDEILTLNVVEAFHDMSFDDRRYLGTAFPRLVDALLKLEDHHK